MGSFVTWKEHYSVGDSSIDAQHKQILEIINELHDAIQADHAYDVLEDVLEQLVLYTMTHFKHEEQMMRACGFPDYDNHKTLHDKMRRRTEGLHSNINLLTGSDVMRFLKEWWLNHIRGEDQCYVPYLSARNRMGSSTAAPTPSVGPVDWTGQTTTHQ